MTLRIQLSLIVSLFVFAFSPEGLALTHDIHLYRVQNIQKQGVSATVRENELGVLECQLVLDQNRMGSPIASIELSSSVQQESIDFELKPHKRGHDLVCRFALSRNLLMHANLTVGVDDGIPGGTFYHVAFVDFVDFGKDLSPALRKRQARLEKMGFLDRHHPGDFENRLERYNDTTPMRGEGIDVKILGSKLEKEFPKVRVVPFSKSPKESAATHQVGDAKRD